MSTADRCWWASVAPGGRRRRRIRRWSAALGLAILLPAIPAVQARSQVGNRAGAQFTVPNPAQSNPAQANQTQAGRDSASQNKASRVVASAIQALGGERWLDLQTVRTEGRTASFFKGAPTGEVQKVIVTAKLPGRNLSGKNSSGKDLSRTDLSGKQRLDFGDKDRVVQIYTDGGAWEITYKGVRMLPRQKVQAHRRWREHSLGRMLRGWFRKPGTILLYDGPSMVERHTADKITLIGPAHQSVTLEIGTESHLPLRLSFRWRDPRFHDKSVSTVAYDNYEHIDGIAIPFTVTRTVNGEIVWERFLREVNFNPELPKKWFDAATQAVRLK